MLNCTVKFCGGCNPRYERSDIFNQIRERLSDIAAFSLPEEGKQYDVLLIIRGCTGCPYLYEDINAAHRLICAGQEDADRIVDEIRAYYHNKKDDDQS